MTYMKEQVFMNKLIASLKINGCMSIDISENNVKKFIPILEENISKLYIRPVTEEEYEDDDIVDGFNFSFHDDDDYSKFYEIIDNLDSLVAKKEKDELYIILDKSTAKIIIGNLSNAFPIDEILKIGRIMKKYMDSAPKKKQKQMQFEINEQKEKEKILEKVIGYACHK